MGTLKTTLKVESTDLFPTPVSFTTVNNNTVAGSYSGFNTITITGGSAQQLDIVTPGVDGCYFYAAAPSTNTETLIITVVAGSTFAQLAPGDVSFISLGDGTGYDFEADTLSGSGTAQINFFVGLKS